MTKPIKQKVDFKVLYLITSFKKSLITKRGQSVLEYSLILIVIAALCLTFLLPAISEEKGGNGSFGFLSRNPIRNAVDRINNHVTGKFQLF